MDSILTQVITRADGFRWFDELAAYVKDADNTEVNDALLYCVSEYLENRDALIHILLATDKVDSETKTKALQVICENFAEDQKSCKLLIQSGANDSVTVSAVIYRLQEISDIYKLAKNDVQQLTDAILQREPRAAFSPEEALLLLAPTFVDTKGQYKILSTFAEKQIPWNIKAAKAENPNLIDKTPFYYLVAENSSLAEKIFDNFVMTKKISPDWKVVDKYDRTMLQASISEPKMFRRLLDVTNHGLGDLWINRKDKTPSKKPLLFAVAGSPNYDKILKPFLSKGADVSITDNSGNTVLHYLYHTGVQQGINPIDKIIDISSIGVPIDLRDIHGRTLLMIVSKEGDTYAANQLMEIGADPSVKGPTGSALDIAEDSMDFKNLVGFKSAIKKFFPRLR